MALYNIILEALDNLLDFVRIIDRDGKVVYENKAMQTYLLRLQERTDEAFPDFPTELFGKKVAREIAIDDRVFMSHLSPIEARSGEVVAMIEVFHDVTHERKMVKDLYEHMRMRVDDIAFARRIQMSLLPTRQHFPGLHFAMRYSSSEDLSGDIFDFFELNDGRTVFYIADVMGKGVAASMMTLFIRQRVRSIFSDTEDLTEAVETLRTSFARMKLGAEHYFTIFIGIYDPEKHEITYVNAGHNAPPVHLNARGSDFLISPGFPVSEVFTEEPYEAYRMKVEPGDRLVFYTDGILEARRGDEEFGMERLREELDRTTDPDVLADRVLGRVENFLQGRKRDDIAIFVMDVLKEESH